MFRRRATPGNPSSPDFSHQIPHPYLEAARNQEEAEQQIQANWQAKLKKIALDNPVVGWAKQTYQLMTSEQVPTSYKVLLIAALLYFLSPLDSIPDVLPGLGYADGRSRGSKTSLVARPYGVDAPPASGRSGAHPLYPVRALTPLH